MNLCVYVYTFFFFTFFFFFVVVILYFNVFYFLLISLEPGFTETTANFIHVIVTATLPVEVVERKLRLPFLAEEMDQ